MAILDDIPKTYDQAAEVLARWHGDEFGEDVQIYLFPDPEQRVVRLIEVGSIFPSSGAVLPIQIRPSGEFPFSSAVAMVTPEEWQQVKDRHLGLPSSWDLESMRRIWPGA